VSGWSRVPKLGHLLASPLKLGPLRVRGAAIAAVVLGTWGVVNLYRTAQLKAPTTLELPVTDDNQMAIWMGTRPPSDLTVLRCHGVVYFGLESFTRSKSRWDLDQNRGVVHYDPAFDLSDRAQMEALLAFAATTSELECPEGVPCLEDEGRLIYSKYIPFVFKKWAEDINGTIPSGEAFLPALKAWLAEDEQELYREDFGFAEDGALRFFMWSLMTNLEFGGENDMFADVAASYPVVRSHIAESLGETPGLSTAVFMATKDDINHHTGVLLRIDLEAFGRMYPILQSVLSLNVLFCLVVSFFYVRQHA